MIGRSVLSEYSMWVEQENMQIIERRGVSIQEQEPPPHVYLVIYHPPFLIVKSKNYLTYFKKIEDNPSFAQFEDNPPFAKCEDNPPFAKCEDNPPFSKCEDNPSSSKCLKNPPFVKSEDNQLLIVQWAVGTTLLL